MLNYYPLEKYSPQGHGIECIYGTLTPGKVSWIRTCRVEIWEFKFWPGEQPVPSWNPLTDPHADCWYLGTRFHMTAALVPAGFGKRIHVATRSGSRTNSTEWGKIFLSTTILGSPIPPAWGTTVSSTLRWVEDTVYYNCPSILGVSVIYKKLGEKQHNLWT